jgi:peroxiredoxin
MVLKIFSGDIVMKSLFLSAALLSAAFAQEFKLGGKVNDFAVEKLQGGAASFASLKGDVTVVAFISVQCPISNDYNSRMNAVVSDFSKKGVKFIFLNANSTEPADAVATHAKQAGFTFPVYKDAGNKVADQFGAQVTPETFVIDKTGTIVYHGYIDDARNEARVTSKGLANALEAVLAGKAVPQAETKAFGCTIKRARKVS